MTELLFFRERKSYYYWYGNANTATARTVQYTEVAKVAVHVCVNP